MMRSRFFLCWCIVLTGLFRIAEPAAAQVYSNFPFASDFGTASAPGADNSLYQFTDLFLSDGGWAIASATDNALYPTYTENDISSFSTLITRPFQFTAGTTYRLSFTYEADAAFSDADYCWRLAPQISDGSYEIAYSADENDPLAPNNKLITVETAGMPTGEQTVGPFDFVPTTTGVYALTFSIYPSGDPEGIFAPDPGAERHLRVKSIKISEKTPYDLAMGKIVTPMSSYSTAPQTVSAWVRNDGSVAVTSFKLCYTVGAQTRVFQTFNQRLEVNAETLVTFDEPANLSSGPNRIRVFLSDRPAGAPTDNDSTPALFISIYDEPYTVPFTFDFDNNTLNQRWTELYDEHTIRTTWQFGQQNDKACAYINTNGTRNNARLASPGISLKGGKTYRFRFHYTGLTSAKEQLAAYMTGADFTDAARMTGYWKDEGFTSNGERSATFFYTPATDGVYHMVLKAYSNDISGGIAVWHMEVDDYDPIHGDFYYEFDPMSVDMTASALFAESAYLMDMNHNGQAWRISTTAAYNGVVAGRAGESFVANGHTSDDWLVFNPVYLQAGKTYTLSYMLRAGDDNRNVVLESMFCREAFAFNASDILKTDRNTINSKTYQKARYTFTPTASGNYQLAFRYNTPIKQETGVTADQFDVYIDHIGLYETERHDFELAYIDIPVGAQMGQHNVYIKCGYRNFGDDISASQLKFCFQINDQPIVAEQALASVSAGGIGQHNFNKAADFSRDTLNYVRIWAQKGDIAITDTFKTTIHSLRSYYPPYRDLLTEESKDEWRISSLATDPSWRFVKDNTFDDPYTIRTTANDGLLDDYLVMPAIHLQKDTVYLLSFYAKGSQDRTNATQTGLSAVYSTKGYGVADFDRNIGHLESLTTEYKRYQFYFKALENAPTFMAFRSQLPAYSGSNWIDHVVVIDSVSASYSYMSLTDIVYRRVAGCDEDRTTAVELEIRNNGYLAYDSVPISYQMDKLPVQTYWLENGVADMETLRFELPERWDLSQSGIHRIQVWVGMPNEADRSDDTLSVSCRIDGMAQLPVGYDFENNVLPGIAEDLNHDGITWELHRNAESAYAGRYYVRYQGTGQSADDNWQLPCFYATTDDYTLDFYMSAPYASEELVEIYLLHYDETDENGQMVRELLYDGVVSHVDYQLYQLPFSIKTGHYGVLFHIKSEADGRTLCIDNLTVSGYGLKDVALLGILDPAEAEAYDDPLDLTVRLRNNGRVKIYDVPLVLTIDGTEMQRVEVPTIESNGDLIYTFPNRIDLHEPGTHRIVVAVDWVLDQRPGNNKQEIVRVQSISSDLALTVLTEPMGGLKPYSNEETVAVRIENRGRTAVANVPISAIINQTQQLNGILPTIESGGAIVYQFEQTADMSDSAWYEFLIYLSPATPDNDPENDTLYSRIDGRYEKERPTISNEPETLAEQLILYPNPVRTTMYITVPQGFDRLEIYSLHGKRYLSRTVTGGTQLEIPADGYPEGMYILRLSGLSGEKTVKWIKVR